VKEIGFPQVGGWLLFKVSSGQSYSAVEETYGMGCGGRDKDITRLCSSNSKTTEKAERVQRKAGNRPPCPSARRGYEQSLVTPDCGLGAPPPPRARTAAPRAERAGGEGWERLRPNAEPGRGGTGRCLSSKLSPNARFGVAPRSL